MMKFTVTGNTDLMQQIIHRLAKLGSSAAPATMAAFNKTGHLIQSVWKGWAMGEPISGIPDIRKPNGKLANSIKINKNSPYEVEVYSESPYMERLVEGTPSIDMKETYPYGRKSRVSKKGVPYLIIPFRWATPNQKGGKRAHFSNTMSADFHKIVEAFKTSKITEETHTEKNYAGEDIERSEYNWGDRLTEVGGNEEGMVRMAGKGGYFTFRIISALSPSASWVRKAVPPVDIEGGVVRTVRPIAEAMVEAGLKADIGL